MFVYLLSRNIDYVATFKSLQFWNVRMMNESVKNDRHDKWVGPKWPLIHWNFTGKNTKIKHTGIRETGVYRHHGGPFQGPLKLFRHHSSMVLRGLREDLNCASIMPKDATAYVIFSSMAHAYDSANCHACIHRNILYIMYIYIYCNI